MALQVTTRRLDGPAPAGSTTWFRSPRRTLDGWGVAAVVEVPAPWPEHLAAVDAFLRDCPTDDEVGQAGCGPVAFGSLPFRRDRPARFVVPAVVVGTCSDGQRWITTVDGAAPSPAVRGTAPTSVELRTSLDPVEWCEQVETATERIRAGELHKVVLAREVTVTADRDWDAVAVGERLAAAHPHSLRYSVEGHVGASPELLVSRLGDVVRAQPMAGTTPRSGDVEIDQRRAAELLASAKNRDEHQITIDAVHDALLGWCSYLDAEPLPSVVPAGSVQHLATLVEGRLAHPTPSVLELVAALHPTPAVGGSPRDDALAVMTELEGLDRGRYAGPVGWVDRAGNGAWAVGIRGVELEGSTARVRAGVGVVADSDPVAELEETRAKLAATLGALTRL